MNKLNHLPLLWMAMVGGEKEKKKQKFWPPKGVETVKKVVKNSIKLKIPILTFYVFSSENWKKKKKYLLFKLFKITF